jgi:ribonuclease HII
MVALHERHPEYGFDVHKGYTTPAHRRALTEFGPSPVHRHRFITVRRAIREGAA